MTVETRSADSKTTVTTHSCAVVPREQLVLPLETIVKASPRAAHPRSLVVARIEEKPAE